MTIPNPLFLLCSTQQMFSVEHILVKYIVHNVFQYISNLALEYMKAPLLYSTD